MDMCSELTDFNIISAESANIYHAGIKHQVLALDTQQCTLHQRIVIKVEGISASMKASKVEITNIEGKVVASKVVSNSSDFNWTFFP
jgi:uncharacterized protein YcfL